MKLPEKHAQGKKRTKDRTQDHQHLEASRRLSHGESQGVAREEEEEKEKQQQQSQERTMFLEGKSDPDGQWVWFWQLDDDQ